MSLESLQHGAPMRRGFTARRNDDDPERGQYGYADHTLRHPHFQVEAVQVNDRIDLLAEITVLPSSKHSFRD